jgi:transcriptional regulator with XRE-family HTH domain
MQMSKIKTEKEVCEYLIKLMKEKGLSRTDLVEFVTKQRYSAYANYELCKSDITKQVSNWLDKKDRYPGTQYIYYLAQALDVTIEEILLCGEDGSQKNIKKRPTLATLAKIKDSEQFIEAIRIFADFYGNSYSGLSNLLDEYGMNIIDYIIKFENMVALKHLIDVKLVSIFPNPSEIVLDNYNSQLIALLKMIVSKEDVETFEKLVDKHLIFTLDNKKGSEYLKIDNEFLSILSMSPKFLKYFSNKYIPTANVYDYIIRDVHIEDLNEMDLQNLERLNGGFEEILNFLIQSNDTQNAHLYLKIAIRHCYYVGKKIKPILKGESLEKLLPFDAYTKRLITLPVLWAGSIHPKCEQGVYRLKEIVKTILSGNQLEERPPRKYYIVTAKCGHVGRNKYKEAKFPLMAYDASEAANIARNKARVKHDHPDAIIETKEVSKEEYLTQKEINNNDPYFRCNSRSEQKKIGEISDIKNETYQHPRKTKHKKHQTLIKNLYLRKNKVKTFSYFKNNSTD